MSAHLPTTHCSVTRAVIRLWTMHSAEESTSWPWKSGKRGSWFFPFSHTSPPNLSQVVSRHQDFSSASSWLCRPRFRLLLWYFLSDLKIFSVIMARSFKTADNSAAAPCKCSVSTTVPALHGLRLRLCCCWFCCLGACLGNSNQSRAVLQVQQRSGMVPSAAPPTAFSTQFCWPRWFCSVFEAEEDNLIRNAENHLSFFSRSKLKSLTSLHFDNQILNIGHLTDLSHLWWGWKLLLLSQLLKNWGCIQVSSSGHLHLFALQVVQHNTKIWYD